MSNPRAAWLIDFGYLAAKRATDSFSIDMIKTKSWLKSLYGSPMMASLYNGYFGDYPEWKHQRLYNLMHQNGITNSLHKMRRGRDGSYEQRRVDVDIAANIVWYSSLPSVKTVILTTGDQDLIPAVSLSLDKFDVDIVLLHFAYPIHPDLIDASTSNVLFDDHARMVELR